MRSLCGQFECIPPVCCLQDRVLVRALSNSSTISFRDNHSGSCWCFCHEQKATKVNGTHFDDKAGTAKCGFKATAPGLQAGMTKCAEERWTPPLQPPRAILAGAHLLNGSPPTSSSFTLTSNSPPLCLHASPWPWRNDRPFNYLHRLIAADCNCRELFRLC